MAGLEDHRDAVLSQGQSFAGEAGARGEPGWLAALRRKGLEAFEEAGFPHPKAEPWRYTPLKRLSEAPFAPATEPGAIAAEDLAPFLVPDLDVHRVVMVDGRLSTEHSDLGGLPEGVRLGSLREALSDETSALEGRLGALGSGAEHGFEALNLALFADGAFLHVPAGVHLEKPVQLLHVGSAAGAGFLNLRNVVVLGEGASARWIETYAGLEGCAHLLNALTEVFLDPAARLDAVRVQREARGGFHLGETRAALKRDSHLASVTVHFGGRVVRNQLSTRLTEVGAHVDLYGVSVTDGEQHVENHTLIDHQSPDTTSDEFYKAVLDGTSRGVFRGQVIVREGADGTDSSQQNKNLLLSRGAEMNTKPELEIYADDVKCAHGATVGQLDPEHLFYLRSRGVGEEDARRLLVQAFARDLLNRVDLEPLRDHLKEVFSRRFGQGR